MGGVVNMSDVNTTQTVTIGRDLWGYIIGAFGVLVGGISIASMRANTASVELVQQVHSERAAIQTEMNAHMRVQIQELRDRVSMLEAWESMRKQREGTK